MLEVAAILSAFAATTGAFLRSADRWPRGAAPSSAMRMILAATVPVGLGASLVFAVLGLGPAPGIGLWCVAVMGTGIAAVSLASRYPRLALRIALLAAASAGPLALAQAWTA